MAATPITNYSPVKTEFAALCARLGLSQRDIADIVPCRLDTVKKWQSGKMKVCPEVLGQLYNMDAAIRSAAGQVASIAEDLVNENGVLILKAPASFDLHSRSEIAPDVLEVFLRGYYAEICLQMLGKYPVEIEVCDIPFDPKLDKIYAPINLLVDEFDPEYYWSNINPARPTYLDPDDFRIMPLEVLIQLRDKVTNFETSTFSRLDILEVSSPKSDGSGYEDRVGIDIEWEGANGMPYLIDLTYPIEVNQIDCEDAGVEIIERTTLNGGHSVVHPKWDHDQQSHDDGISQMADEILQLLSTKFETVDALISAVTSHENHEGDLAA